MAATADAQATATPRADGPTRPAADLMAAERSRAAICRANPSSSSTSNDKDPLLGSWCSTARTDSSRPMRPPTSPIQGHELWSAAFVEGDAAWSCPGTGLIRVTNEDEHGGHFRGNSALFFSRLYPFSARRYCLGRATRPLASSSPWERPAVGAPDAGHPYAHASLVVLEQPARGHRPGIIVLVAGHVASKPRSNTPMVREGASLGADPGRMTLLKSHELWSAAFIDGGVGWSCDEAGVVLVNNNEGNASRSRGDGSSLARAYLRSLPVPVIRDAPEDRLELISVEGHPGLLEHGFEGYPIRACQPGRP